MNLLTNALGKVSSNRTIAVWAWGVFGLCYVYASIKSGKLAEIPETTLIFLGIASGGSVGNSYLNERQIVNKDNK